MQTYPSPPALQPAGTMKHSRLGIASFVLGVAIILFVIFVILLFTVIATMNHRDNFWDPESLTANQRLMMMMSLTGFAVIMGHLLGVALGIAGVAQKNRKLIFAVLGLELNAGALLLIGVIAVGLAAR